MLTLDRNGLNTKRFILCELFFFQEQLDMRLQQRQARETGICPVRRELYSQCFGKSDFFLYFGDTVFGNVCSPKIVDRCGNVLI